MKEIMFPPAFGRAWSRAQGERRSPVQTPFRLENASQTNIIQKTSLVLLATCSMAKLFSSPLGMCLAELNALFLGIET